MVWRFEANERDGLGRTVQDFGSCIGSKNEQESLLAKCYKPVYSRSAQNDILPDSPENNILVDLLAHKATCMKLRS